MFPIRKNANSKIRIIAFVKESISSQIKIRVDLMSTEFPSIWLELNNNIMKNSLVAGFYRQWSNEDGTKEDAEEIGMNIFSEQLEKAYKEEKNLIVMGDANLCSNKWQNPTFTNKKIANQLIGTLEACGLKIVPVGPTFIADHCQPDGSITESWLDHVYHSDQVKSEISTKIINYGSSDHLPVIISQKALLDRKMFKRKIVKRKMKNFSNNGWNEALMKKDWSKIYEMNDLDKKVETFTNLVTECLDEVAPFGTIVIRSNYKFGLSDVTKDMMKKREAARLMIKNSNGNQKQVWNEKYKKLRNAVTSQIRKDTIDANNNRIDAAKDENEVWKVAKEIINPMKENNWSMKINNIITDDPVEISNTFNSYFVKKIEDLKENIDPTLKSDPLNKLKENLKNKKCKFELKTVSIKSLKKSITQLKSKNSAGSDGLSQKQLKSGVSSLASPLQNIINASIKKGEFPSCWKEAIVTPVFKKGNKSDFENYRPVSCLPAAAKLLELVACQQTSLYMEENSLLPKSQHGFRKMRSTMTALTEVQKQWADNTEKYYYIRRQAVGRGGEA